MKKLIILVGILLILGAVVFFWNRSKSQSTQETTAIVRRETLIVPLTLSGEMKAKEQYTVRFQTTGLVTGIHSAEGETVTKNQLLASLDQRKLKNDMQQLLNTYMDSRWNFEQVKNDNQTTAELAAQQAVRERAQRLIDRSQFSLNNSVLDVEAQALALEFASLYSPINGIVTKAPEITTGINITTPSQAEFEVVNPDSLYFEALADQTEVTLLQTGKIATLFLDAFPDSTLSGVLQSISFTPQQGEVGTVYAIDISIAALNRDQFRLGMTGDVTFVTTSKENALLVPLSFVTSKAGKRYMKIKENNKIVEKEVTTGLENDTDIEILSGITEGTVVYD